MVEATDMDQQDMTFWQHVDVLRGGIIRCLVAILACTIVTFCFREPVFRILFWSADATFPLWRIWPLEQSVQFINTELAQQFIVHIQVSLALGALAVLPYMLYELMRFIHPALYPHEKRAVLPIVVCGYLMFMLGAALSYFLIFPLTFRFLADYQVASSVSNIISLQSFISTELMLSVLMGLISELPVICAIMARMGLLHAAPMAHFRKHAIVVILIIAAIITPTGDAFTLTIVSLPIYLLYELSILVVGLLNPQNKRSEALQHQKNKQE